MMERKYRQRPGAWVMGKLAHLLVIACAVGLSACTEEDPTDIGGVILPEGEVATFEVILEPSQFLTFDTAFSGYLEAGHSLFVQVMRDFEGVTDANGLYHFGFLERKITVRDTSGAAREDTLPRIPDGYLLLRLDSMASRGAATFGAYQTTQEWHAGSADWTMRIDTGNVHLPWTTPGGTRGALLGTAQWRPGTGVDSLMIPLDSIKIKALTDTANHARGLLLTLDQATGTAGASLRVNEVVLRVNAKSNIRPDTTVVLTVGVNADFTFVFSPSPPTNVAGTLRVSGVPSWRCMLGVIDNLGGLTVPCPGTSCTVRLRDAHVNIAELLLQPTGSPAGFSPEDSVQIVAQTMLDIPGVPLSRSALGGRGDDQRRRSPIPAQRFTNADAGPPFKLPITPYIGALVRDTATESTQRVPRRLALLGVPQAGSFGFANFRAGPRLRLVLTISTEQQ